MSRVSLLCRSMARMIWCRRRTRSFGRLSTSPRKMGIVRQEMMNLEKIKSEIEAAVPGCSVEIVVNGSPSGQHSLAVGLVEGVEKKVEEVRKTRTPGYLEAVYHLYSMEKKHGPLVVRMRTENRGDGV